ERRQDRRRPVHRGAGHGGRTAIRARRARFAARARGRGHPSARRAPAGDPRRSDPAARMTPAAHSIGPVLVVATTNPGKIREIVAILAGVPIEIRTLADFPAVQEPEETGATFAENARLKALYYADALGLPCVADDS